MGPGAWRRGWASSPAASAATPPGRWPRRSPGPATPSGTGTSPAIGRAGVGIPSVSATYNLIHPDAGLRAAQTAQAVRLIGLAPDLGAEVVTLCSGTRDPDDIWRAHPAEPGHRRLDPANLLSPATIARQREILAEAVDRLGPGVIGVQAKDVAASGSAAAGAGLLDYPEVFRQLAGLPPVPVIVQDAAEDDAARVRDDLLRWHRQAGGARDGGGRMPA